MTTEQKKFAVIKIGGKQYKVSEGQRFVANLPRDIQETTLSVKDVLACGDDAGQSKIGTPLVNGASVECKVLGPKLDAKVTIYKKNRRKGYTKKQGHRQAQIELQVSSIAL